MPTSPPPDPAWCRCGDPYQRANEGLVCPHCDGGPCPELFCVRCANAKASGVGR
jgi:hypothetical protein